VAVRTTIDGGVPESKENILMCKKKRKLFLYSFDTDFEGDH